MGWRGSASSARDALAAAEILVGGSRHLALLPEDGRPRLAWRSPLADTLAELLALRARPRGRRRDGDPLWYGVGRLLLRHVPAGEVRVLPHVSAFQQACSRLGWAMEEVARAQRARPLDREPRAATCSPAGDCSC